MALFLFKVSLLFLCFSGFTLGNLPDSPRMIFTQKDTAVTRSLSDEPVQILLEEQQDTVTLVGQTNLTSFNTQNLTKGLEKRDVLCTDSEKDCNYKITIVHKQEKANKVFLCGTNGKETTCCDMKLSDQNSTCDSSKKIEHILGSIREFILKEGEPFAFVESAKSANLYVTNSGSQEYVGIHKFGEHRVRPANHDKEQHYVGLISQRGSSLQDKVYAFYREKNKDTDLDSEFWLPFVTRICMADVGGPKNNLQFSWTSQMNARLFCGDSKSRQHFSELIDVATVQAEEWKDTTVYALFKNEWGMSAVCVYTMRDIDGIFATSSFKGNGNQKNRPRECVEDSTKISLEGLRVIEKTTEMEKWVHPVENSGPLLVNHHNYRRIHVDSSQHRRNKNHTVLFLSLNNGGIHKAIHNKTQALVIAEYQPFNHQAHVSSFMLHPSSGKLYVTSRSELVQVNVANCAQYGDKCEDCVLARDPYCGWDGTHCTPNGTLQDVTTGNHAICQHEYQALRYSTGINGDKGVDTSIPAESKYFLRCPVSSHHAQYTWHHTEGSISCSSNEQHCLFLIDSMGPKQEGTYKCESKEMGYSKVLAQYRLSMANKAAGRISSRFFWVCLVAVLIMSLYC